MRRFYIPPDEFGERIRLAEDESRHLSKVLRLGAGDEVRVFDGVGREYVFAVEEPDRRGVLIRFVREAEPFAPESGLNLTLALPLLKKSNTELVLQKAVELGVKRFVPLICARGEVPAKKWKPERAHRIACEAAKQCGRATIPSIDKPVEFGIFARGIAGTGILFYEETAEQHLPGSLESVDVVAITGPEGGWEKAEIETASSAGIRIVHFAGRILKAETAAITAAVILQHKYGDLK